MRRYYLPKAIRFLRSRDIKVYSFSNNKLWGLNPDKLGIGMLK